MHASTEQTRACSRIDPRISVDARRSGKCKPTRSRGRRACSVPTCAARGSRARRKVRILWRGLRRTLPRCSTCSASSALALVGHSMGGYVALAFARMFTERVTRLALVASRLRADTSGEAAARREMADRVERRRQHRTGNRGVSAAVIRTANLTPSAATSSSARTKSPGTTILPEWPRRCAAWRCAPRRKTSPSDLDVPMLLIAGAHDSRRRDRKKRERSRRDFREGGSWFASESGHLPMLEEPQRVTEALEGWLSGLLTDDRKVRAAAQEVVKEEGRRRRRLR